MQHEFSKYVFKHQNIETGTLFTDDSRKSSPRFRKEYYPQCHRIQPQSFLSSCIVVDYLVVCSFFCDIHNGDASSLV